MTSVTHVSERLLPMSPVCTALRALGNGSLDSGEPRSGDRELVNPGPLTTRNRCRPFGSLSLGG